MHKKTINLKHQIVPFLIPVILISLLVLTTRSSLFMAQPKLTSALITIDLILTIPFLYFLIIRKKKILIYTIIPAVGLGLFVCNKIIPLEHQIILPVLAKWLLPITETVVIGYILLHLKKARRKHLQRKGSRLDFYTTTKRIAEDILPSVIARIIATEIAVVYYSLFSWKKRPLNEGEFSNYKKSTTTSSLLGIMLIITVETFVFHYILKQQGATKVWGITLLSLYTLIQILGFLKSHIKRPITFKGNMLYLRYGIMKETSIHLDNISSIVLSSNSTIPSNSLSIFGKHESYNVILILKQEETLYTLYGFKKKYLTISFFVDEPQLFFNKTCKSIKQLQEASKANANSH